MLQDYEQERMEGKKGRTRKDIGDGVLDEKDREGTFRRETRKDMGTILSGKDKTERKKNKNRRISTRGKQGNGETE